MPLKVSVQFSHSVVSDHLRPHGLQHARLACLSPTPGACSNSCSSSWWWTGRPGVLRFMGSQRVGHDWVTELNWMMSSVFRASCSVVSDFFWPYGLQPVRLFCPWDSPDKNTGVGCHALLQGLFKTKRSTHISCIDKGNFFFTTEPPMMSLKKLFRI